MKQEPNPPLLTTKATSETKSILPDCDCNTDAFVVLPPELRPHSKSWKKDFRKVTCPGCGLVFWTNMEDDWCNDCRRQGLHQHSVIHPKQQ